MRNGIVYYKNINGAYEMMSMRIMWLCNTPLPEICSALGMTCHTESWLIGISNQLRINNDIELHYVFPQGVRKRIVHRKINNIVFWGFYDIHKNLFHIENENIKMFSELTNNIKPDIIHIFGTELPHSLECVKSLYDTSRVIVSIQGLTSEIAKVYLEGIPFRDKVIGRFVNKQYTSLLTERYEFYRRGQNEKGLLRNVKNVIGRTDWDQKCVKTINPKCHYYYCSETLREVFYDGKWDINHIQRNSIFVSQAYYPIKGLHVLIRAIPFISRQFPNVRVYVAGNKNFLENGNHYGAYIKKLMKKYHAEKQIIFLDTLSDKRVKERLLSTHISVMPSIIENSPNSIGEAMILGTPIVAANVGGIPSIVRDGVDGYLYTSGNERELAKAICRIFMNDAVALKFSNREYRQSRKLYSRESNAQQLIEIYKQVAR